MRKLRVIAAILCIVMVGCVFPILPVAAAETYDTIGEVLGCGVKVTQDYDLTSSDQGKAASPAVHEPGVGVNMNNGGYWRIGGSGSSSLGLGKAIYFRFKAEEGKNTSLYLHIPNPTNDTGSQAAYCLTLNENGVQTIDHNTYKAYCYEVVAEHVDFEPGTEFAEYLAVDREDGTGLHIYAKQGGLHGGEWVKTARIIGNYPNLSASSEFYMTTNGTLAAVTSYEGFSFASITEVMGKDVEPHHEFDFSADIFGSNPEYNVSGDVSYSATDGMTINGGNWTYLPEAGYLPLDSGSRCVTFSAKPLNASDSLKVCYADPSGGDAYGTIEISASAIQATGCKNVLYRSDFVPGTDWVDYLLAVSGDCVFLSTLNNGEWDLVLQTKGCTAPESTDTGLTFTGIGCVKETTIYGGIFEVLSADEVAASERAVWMEEDFSSPSEDWVMSNGAAIDTDAGTLSVGGQASSIAEHPLQDYKLGSTWRARFKIRFDSGENHVFYIAHGGQRLYFVIRPQENNIGVMGGGEIAGVETTYGKWYEFFFEFTEGNVVSVYRRDVGSSTWQTLRSDMTINDASTRTCILFSGAETNRMTVDDLMVYQGNVAKLEEPTVASTSVSVAGSFDNTNPSDTKARQISVLAVAYDKEYGYTTQVQEETYQVHPGKALNLNPQFNLSGFDAERQNVSTMIWDDVENGVPLAASTGYVIADTSDVEPTDGQGLGIDAAATYNEVVLSGYVGTEKGIVTATLSKDGTVYAAIQALANRRGVIQAPIAVDPEVCQSGTYTLRVQYGNQVASESAVSLYCNDIIPTTGITSAQELENFIQTYGDTELKDAIATDGLLPYAYKHYQKLVANDVVDNIYEMRSCLENSIKNGIDEIALLAAVNQAVTQKNWYEIEKLMSITYKDLLGFSQDATAGVLSTKDLFLRMTGGYASAEALLADFDVAKAAQIAAQGSGASGGFVGGGNFSGGGGAGGGGFAGGGSLGGGAVSVNPDSLPDSMTEPITAPTAIVKFTDLESVPWAEESIEALREMGVIAGDGDGTFAPNRAVSREEFLKIAMEAAGIAIHENATVSFEDVIPGEWYYPYVATAFEMGIINGISETQFGIGRQITRADMAVMLDRILNTCGITLEELDDTVIFDDWMQIPVYARGSVAELCDEGLLQGVGNNLFAPLNSATRAEAAVAIYRIYGYMNEGR